MTPEPLTPAEAALLAAVDGLGPDVPGAEAHRAIGDTLRSTLSFEVNLADDVMLALALNQALAGEMDVADDVMLAIQLNESVSGGTDIANDVMLTIALHQALSGESDVADDVMLAIQLNESVSGGTDVVSDVMLAIGLNEAVRPSPVDLADRVMAEVGERALAMPRWASLGVPAAFVVAAAMAAAALFAVFVPNVQAPTETLTAEVSLPVLTLAKFNEAEVEDIETADNTTVQVMQFEEGAPTIIFVQEDAG